MTSGALRAPPRSRCRSLAADRGGLRPCSLGPGPGPAPADRGGTRPRFPCAAALARGKKGVRGTFGPLRSPCRPRARFALPSARARSGLRRAFAAPVPGLGSLAPPVGPSRARPSGRSCPPPPSLRAVLRPGPVRARSPRPCCSGSPCGPLWAPCGRPWAPPGSPPRQRAARCAGAPLPRPGCARLRFACPRCSRRGPMAALSGRFFRPPGPRRFWGLGRSAAAAAGAGAIGPALRGACVWFGSKGVFWRVAAPFARYRKGILAGSVGVNWGDITGVPYIWGVDISPHRQYNKGMEACCRGLHDIRSGSAGGK